jgi:hypothetical protein
MADRLIMSYYLRKDNNSESSTYNRWYAFVDRAGLISTRGLAEYLVNIGVKLDRSELESIIVRLAQAIPEIVAQGYSVKVEGLGVFSAFIANQKGGAPDPSKFNIQEHVKGVRFRFRPDSSDLDNLTSKTFGKHVSLGNGSYVLEKGSKAPKYPLAAYKPAVRRPTPSPPCEGGGG